jgi:hypothetical protein
MGLSALACIFTTERRRQRQAAVGFSVPAMGEVRVPEDAMPLLASNMRGTFLPTRRSGAGIGRYGFSPCRVEEEPLALSALYQALTELSTREGWANRCSDLTQAIERLRSSGFEPRSMVIPEQTLRDVCGPDCDLEAARRSMAVQGHVAVVDGIRVLLSNLPGGAALVCAAPEVVGLYTRVGDHLGVLVQRVDRAIMVVRHDMA